jgi:hypothetical protein
MSYREHLARYHSTAAQCGLSYMQADSVRRDAQRLHTWCKRECNGEVQRFEPSDAVTDHKGRPLVGTFSAYNINGPGPIRYSKTPDRETGALARIRGVAALVGATVEYQGDPRGWPITLKFSDGRELCPPVRG